MSKDERAESRTEGALGRDVQKIGRVKRGSNQGEVMGLAKQETQTINFIE